MRRAASALLFLLAGCSGNPAAAPVTGESFLEEFETHDPLPPGWTKVSGSWFIRDTPDAPSGEHTLLRASGANGTRGLVVAQGKGTFADFSASVQVRLITGTETRNAGIAFRYVDASNYYVARLDGAAGRVDLVEFDDGGRRVAHTATTAILPPQEWATLGLVARGAEFSVLINHARVLVASDESIPVGFVGLWAEDDGGTQFDDLRVDRASA